MRGLGVWQRRRGWGVGGSGLRVCISWGFCFMVFLVSRGYGDLGIFAKIFYFCEWGWGASCMKLFRGFQPLWV